MSEIRYLLLEIAHLCEARLDFLRDKYVPLLTSAIQSHQVELTQEVRDHAENQWVQQTIGKRIPNEQKALLQTQAMAQTLFDTIVATDPDVHKKNTQWLLNVIVSGQSLVEDLPKAQYYLTVFQKVQKLLPVEQRNLHTIRSFADLYAIIEPKEQEMSKREADRQQHELMHAPENATVIMNTADYKIVIPHTEAASCHFGVNTQWCTTAAYKNNQFNSYNAQGPLYIILDKKTNQRWQYHFPTGQFTNERDQRIDIPSFAAAHPDVIKVLTDHLPKAVAYLQTYPVFKMPNGMFVRKDRTVNAAEPLLTLSVENGEFKSTGRSANDFSSEEIAKLLNKLHIRGNPTGGPDFKYDLYYRPIGGELGFEDLRWQTVAEASKPLLRLSDGWMWKGIKSERTTADQTLETEFDLILIPQDFEKIAAISEAPKQLGYVCRALIKDGTFEVVQTPLSPGVASYAPNFKTRNRTVASLIGKYLVDLLLKVNGIKQWEGSREFSPSMLGKEDAQRLLDGKPFLADLRTVFNAKGVTPATKKMVLKTLEKEDITHHNVWLNDRLIVLEWDNIDEAVDDIATTEGKSFYKYYITDGGMHDADWPSSVDSYQQSDFLTALKKSDPETLKKLGEYLANEHPDLVEEFDDYDPTDLDNVNELLRNSEDDTVFDAMKQAIAAGHESGAQAEAFKIFQKSVDSNEFLFFKQPPPKGRKRPVYTGKFVWDTPLVMAVPMATIIDLLDDAYTLQGDGWVGTVEGSQINPETPYHGFTDYDDDYANTIFIEKVEEFLP